MSAFWNNTYCISPGMSVLEDASVGNFESMSDCISRCTKAQSAPHLLELCVKQLRLEIPRNVIYDRSRNMEEKKSEDR